MIANFFQLNVNVIDFNIANSSTFGRMIKESMKFAKEYPPQSNQPPLHGAGYCLHPGPPALIVNFILMTTYVRAGCTMGARQPTQTTVGISSSNFLNFIIL